MHAGLWLGGHTVPVARVHARVNLDELAGSRTTLSFSYISDSSVADALFKAQLNPTLGCLSGFSVTVGDKQTTGSFISSEKATDLYGNDTLSSQHTFSKGDDKEWIICSIGELESNTPISINISFVQELSSSSESLLFSLPVIQWLESKTELSYALEVEVNIKSTVEPTISSPSPITITRTNNNTQVTLSTEVKNEEFSLRLTPKSSHSYIVERSPSDSGDKYCTFLSLFTSESTPANVNVEWGGLNVKQVPQTITPKSNYVPIYAFSSEAPRTTITLSADGISPIVHTFTETDEEEGTFVHQLAACARIRELEETGSPSSKADIRDLALQSGVATPFTSVFAKSGRVSFVSVRPSAAKPESLSTSGGEDSSSPLSSPQASPNTASGRKVYDSKFLLSFREHFTDMPEGLPPIDIILGKGGPPTPTRERPPRKPRKNNQPPATPVEPLKPTDGRWVRPSNDVAASALLQRNVLALLNKLTLERFDGLSTQFATLKLTCVEDLTEVCKLVFEKAIAEQHFCSMYADLCKKLSEAYPTFQITEGEQTVTQTFKRLLLNMCQKEFECTPPVPQEGQDKLEFDALELKYRRRTLGNIRFIGELFKLALLRGAIMHECVTRLLVPTHGHAANSAPAANGTPTETGAAANGTPAANGAPATNGTPAANGTAQPLPTEEDLEALCKLLQTIGKRLDMPGPDRQKVERYFSIIASLSRNLELPSRNRFMLLDLIDLRKNDWVPRRVINGPKTIAAVHADAEKADRLAKEETALRESGGHRFSNTHLRSSGGVERDAKDRRDVRNRDGGDREENDSKDRNNEKETLRSSSEVEKDGWETVGKSTKGNVDKWEVAGSKNKRGGGSGGFQEVKGGRRDSFKPAQGSRGNSNRDNRDSRDNRDNRDNRDKKKDKSRDQPQQQQQQQQRGKQAPANKEKERAPAPKGNVFSSLNDDDEESNSSSGSAAPTPRSGNTTPKASATPSLSPAQLEARTDVILAEYLSIVDVPEAVESIKELNTPDHHPQIVVHAINLVLERNKPNQLEQIEALFAAAFGSEPETLTRGFDMVLESIEDLDIDIPMASKHVATLIGAFIAKGTLPFSYLFQALSHLVESGKAEVMVGAALQKILKDVGETKLLEMYDSTQRNLKELFKSGRTKDFIDTFLQTKELAFLAERLS